MVSAESKNASTIFHHSKCCFHVSVYIYIYIELARTWNCKKNTTVFQLPPWPLALTEATNISNGMNVLSFQGVTTLQRGPAQTVSEKKPNQIVCEVRKSVHEVCMEAWCKVRKMTAPGTHSVDWPTQWNSAYLSLLDGLQRRFLDAITVLVKLHVAQHHAGTQQQGRGVGLVLPSYVWSRAVNLSHKKHRTCCTERWPCCRTMQRHAGTP